MLSAVEFADVLIYLTKHDLRGLTWLRTMMEYRIGGPERSKSAKDILDNEGKFTERVKFFTADAEDRIHLLKLIQSAASLSEHKLVGTVVYGTAAGSIAADLVGQLFDEGR